MRRATDRLAADRAGAIGPVAPVEHGARRAHAFLGRFLTNVTYDAHYVAGDAAGLFGARGQPGIALAVRFWRAPSGR